jgi:hypothetical protein
MPLEMEIVYTLITLCSIVGFMMGNLISPSTRFAKKEIAYWRGLTGDFKKQLKTEKRSNSESGKKSKARRHRRYQGFNWSGYC